MGERANLAVLDLDAEWEVAEDGFRSLSANSWLLGEMLRGTVMRTIADGRISPHDAATGERGHFVAQSH